MSKFTFVPRNSRKTLAGWSMTLFAHNAKEAIDRFRELAGDTLGFIMYDGDARLIDVFPDVMNGVKLTVK